MRDDVKRVLEEFEIKTFGNKKELARAEELLDREEKVLFASPTVVLVTHANTRKKDKLPGVVFLTDKRVFFSYKVLSSFSMESVALNEIQSIDCSGNGMSGGHVGIHTLTKSFDFLVTYKQEMVQKIRRTFEEAKSGFSAAASGNSAADEILKYKALLDSGAITAAEFEAKKKQLLGL